MLPALLIGVGLTIGAGMMNSASQRRQGKSAAAWQRWNAQNQYNISMGNIQAGLAIGQFNAGLAQMGAQVNASIIQKLSSYNAKMVWSTTLYNDMLYEEELRLMWQGVKLDQKLLEQERALERGAIEAGQAASGTVMGVGSNEDVIVGQMTQEALDASIIKHGADIQAGRIQNARSRSLWEGEMQRRSILYEGQLGAFAEIAKGNISAMGILGNSQLKAEADKMSAGYALQAGQYGADFTEYSYNAQADNTMMQAFFGAAKMGLSAWAGAGYPGMGGGSSSSYGGSWGGSTTPSYAGQRPGIPGMGGAPPGTGIGWGGY